MEEESETCAVMARTATGQDESQPACDSEAAPTLEALRAAGTLSTTALTASWVDAVAQCGTEQLVDLEALLAAPATQDVTEQEGGGRPAVPTSTSRRGGKRARAAATTTTSATTMAPSGTRPRRTAHGSTRPTTTEREASLLFRRSQHTLRRAAATISMREVTEKVLSQTQMVEVDNDNNAAIAATSISSNNSDRANAELPLTMIDGGRRADAGVLPGALSTAGSSAPASPLGPWSPTSVEELTQNFLATVEQQRRQRVARLLPREVKSFVASARRGVPCAAAAAAAVPPFVVGGALSSEESNTADAHAVDPADDSRDELVIDENEDAIWLPPGAVPGQLGVATGPGGGMLREGPSPAAAARHVLPAYLTANSQSLAPSSLEAEEASQREVAKALARKHEMWKLRQRQLRARQAQQDDAVRGKTGSRASAAHKATGRLAGLTMLSSSSLVTPITTPRDVTTLLTHMDSSGNDSSPTVFAAGPLADSASSSVATPTTNSVRQVNLSDDVISMIRRVNSFEHTSSQHIVIFDRAPRSKTT